MTARTEIVSLLNTALAGLGITVVAYARTLEPAGPTVMVRIDEVAPSTLPNAQRVYKCACICLVPNLTPGTADDALDGLLEDVLFALEGSAIPNGVIFDKATRATFEEKFPAYQVDISVHITKG